MNTCNESKFTRHRAASFVATFLLLGTAAGWLISCASPQGGVGTETGSESHTSIFPINVLLYAQPVEVASWTPDPAQMANPEGAALNVVAAMQRGDVEAWLNCWASDERPRMTAEERQTLLEKWAPLRNGRIQVSGRVVAAADIIEEISVQGPQPDPLQIPLKHQGGKWWLTKMDAHDEYMQWQTSPKKLVERIDPASFRHYLDDVQAHAK